MQVPTLFQWTTIANNIADQKPTQIQDFSKTLINQFRHLLSFQLLLDQHEKYLFFCFYSLIISKSTRMGSCICGNTSATIKVEVSTEPTEQQIAKIVQNGPIGQLYTQHQNQVVKLTQDIPNYYHQEEQPSRPQPVSQDHVNINVNEQQQIPQAPRRELQAIESNQTREKFINIGANVTSLVSTVCNKCIKFMPSFTKPNSSRMCNNCKGQGFVYINSLSNTCSLCKRKVDSSQTLKCTELCNKCLGIGILWT